MPLSMRTAIPIGICFFLLQGIELNTNYITFRNVCNITFKLMFRKNPAGLFVYYRSFPAHLCAKCRPLAPFRLMTREFCFKKKEEKKKQI